MTHKIKKLWRRLTSREHRASPLSVGKLELLQTIEDTPAEPSSSIQRSANAYFDAQNGVWVAIDAPSLAATVNVTHGVLSIRGWAWSRDDGPGVVKAIIRQAETTTEYYCVHRYCRFDVSSAIPAIPFDSYTGFELSIDRYDLPQHCTLTVTCTFANRAIQMGAVSVEASHAGTYGELIEVRCDCCGGTELEGLGKKDGLLVQRCRNCGLAFTAPRPAFEVIRLRYSPQYFEHEYLPEMQKNNLFQEHRARWNSYLDQVEPFRPISSRLFEVGCGAGYLLREGQTRGWQVQGLDLNPAAVAYARSLGVSAEVGDVAEYDFGGHRFGAVILESVLEHVLSPRAVLQKCAAALLPGGGLFILTLGYEGNVFITQGMAFQYVGPSEHLFYFSNSSLCRLCEEAGLRVEHLWQDETHDTILLLATRRFDMMEAHQGSD